jgi:hypothetical protein
MQAKFKENVNIDKIDGMKSLCLEPITVTESIELFDESQYKMTRALSLCDVFYFGSVENNDIFCIYYRKSITEDMARKAIRDLVIDENIENIVNKEDMLINESIRHINYSQTSSHKFYCDSTVFWDVNNNMIIILGKDNCIRMAYVLETEAYRSFVKNDPVYDCVNDNNIHGFTKKIKAFSHNN